MKKNNKVIKKTNNKVEKPKQESFEENGENKIRTTFSNGEVMVRTL